MPERNIQPLPPEELHKINGEPESKPAHVAPVQQPAAPASPEQVSFQAPTPQPLNSTPIGVSASDLGLHDIKESLPKGIYAIAAVYFVFFVVSMVIGGSGSTALISSLLNLILAVGLLARINLVRQLLMILLGLSVVSGIIAIISFSLLFQRVETLKEKSDAAIARVEKTANPRALKALNSIKNEHAKKKSELDKAATRFYIINGSSALIAASVFYYITRPGVKAAFKKDE